MGQEGGPDRPGRDREPAGHEPADQGEHEHVAAPARCPGPRRERVDEGLDDDRRARVDPDEQEQPQHRAAEGRLVDERRPERVEHRARVGPGRREADPPVAEEGVRGRLEHPQGAEPEAQEERLPAVAEGDPEVAGRVRVDDEQGAHEGEPEQGPAEAPRQRGSVAVARRFVVLGRAEVLGFEAQDDEEDGDREGDEDAERLLHGGQASSPILRTARKASCGISTEPTRFMRCLPSFCFSSNFRLRVMSPP